MNNRPVLKRWLPSIALALLAVMVLAACGSDSSGGGGAASTTPSSTTSAGGGGQTVSVSIKDLSFKPAKLEIAAGTTVTWTNNDGTAHTVTATKGDDIDAAVSGLFDSGDLHQGDTFSYTFDKAGDYYYECTIHASMKSMHAEVEVK
jgi:plastocyanin